MSNIYVFHPGLFNWPRIQSFGNLPSTSNSTVTLPIIAKKDTPSIFTAESSRQIVSLPLTWQKALTANNYKRRRTSNSPPSENMIQTSNSFTGLTYLQMHSLNAPWAIATIRSTTRDARYTVI
ncbi:unnamed protein product [Euphydryas editha]|uniref:Uncharacterized protein n=1 Tax=Euphydryas editha TaxID=104508 RepID=A0AAU9UWB5_EUPED|nr:unnamed protein product [Euphydryas editha]